MPACLTRGLAGLALCVFSWATVANGAEKPPVDFLRNALDPNPTLRAYTASASLIVRLRFPIPARKTLNGTVLYRRPAGTITFQNVPRSLERFSQMMSQTPSFEEVAGSFEINPVGDDGKTSSYTLTPRKEGGRVRSVAINVDDATHLIRDVTWIYSEGGLLSVSYEYVNVGSYKLPGGATITARFPAYNAVGVLRFSNYRVE